MMVRTGRRLASAFIMLGVGLPLAAAAAPARDPSGTWLTEDARARIRLEKCGSGSENLCGYVVWLKPSAEGDGSSRVDAKNPDAKKRARPVLGHQLILGLTANEEGQYVGKIYNNEDGKKYDVTIWLDAPATLKVKGCLIAFLCSTQTWKKTSDVIAGQLTGPTGSANGPKPDPEWASATQSGSAKREPKPRS